MERLADRTMSGGGDAHAQARPPALNIAGLVGGSALSSSGRLEKLRQLINGALFYLTDKTGKNYDVLFSVVWPTVAVVLDACQLVGLAMTPEWHSPSVSWLQVGLDFYVQFQRANFAFVFLYWAVIAVLGLTFALTAHAAYMYHLHSFRIFPIRILRALVPLLVSAFYIPVLRLVTTPYFCQLQSQSAGDGASSLCSSSQQVAALAASSAALVMYLPFAGVMAAVFHDMSPLSADVTARTHGRVHLAYVAVQSVLVFVGPPLRERQSFLFLLLVSSACFLMSSLFVVLQPHYHRPMNMLRAGCFAAAGTFAIGSLVLSGTDEANRIIISVSFIGLMPVIGSCAALAIYMRLRHIRLAIVKSIRNGFQGMTDDHFEDGDVEGGESANAGVSFKRRRNPIHSITDQRRDRHSGGGIFARSKGFLMEAQVEIWARVALTDPSIREEGIEAAEAIFEAGLARFKTSAYVALHYAVFLSTFKKEQQLATHRLRMAERLPRVGLDVGFLLQAKRRAIVQMDQSKSLGEDAGLSVVAFLEFQQTLEDATKHQNMALQEIRSFWRNMQRLSNSLTWEGARTERRPGALGGRLQAGPRRNGNGGRRGAMNEPNGAGLASLVAISGLEQRLATIEKSKLRTEGAYQRLISKFPRSPALCRAYAYFKAEVCNQHADAAIYHARADEIEDAEAMALALAGPQGAGSAGGGSATNDNDAGQDDRDTGSVLSKSFKKQRDRSDPAAALLEAAAMKGARAVRMLQRGIVVGCWLLLILLVALCSTSIDRLQDQHGAMDRFVSVSFIRTSIARTVDSVRSVSLAARAASVDGLAAASAAAQERARAILVRSRELYYAGDRAAASWSSIRFDAPLYIAPLPASTAAAAAASTSTSNASRSDGATVAMTSMSTLDGVLVFVDRVGAVASAPAKAVPVDPAFRYVCDAGLGSLASAMQRLGGVYEEAFALDLNALYVRYAALTAAYVAVAIFSGVFVSVGLTNVSRDKINLADVVVKIPKTLIKSVVKHYEAVKIITSDTEEERGDRTHRGLDSQRSFEMEGLSSREHDAYTYAARAGRGRRRSAARSVAGSVEDGDGERVGRRRSVDRSAAGAGRGAGLGFANIVSLAIAKRKVEEARLIPAPSGSLDAGAHGHGQDQPKRDVDAPLGARDGGIASGDDGTGAGLRLTLDRMKSFAMAQRQEKEKETQQGKAADGTDPEPGPMNFAPAAVSAAGAAGSSSSAQPQPQPVAVTAVAPFRLDPFTVDVFSLGEDAPRLSGPVAVSLMDDDDFAPNGSGSSLSSDPRDRDPERKGSGTGPGDGEAQLRMQPVALIPSMALITSPSVQRDLESGLKADAFPAAVDVDAAAPAASAIIDVRRDTQAEPKGTSTVLAGSELTSPTEASATGTSRWLLPVVLETKGRDVAADDSAPGKEPDSVATLALKQPPTLAMAMVDLEETHPAPQVQDAPAAATATPASAPDPQPTAVAATSSDREEPRGSVGPRLSGASFKTSTYMVLRGGPNSGAGAGNGTAAGPAGRPPIASASRSNLFPPALRRIIERESREQAETSGPGPGSGSGSASDGSKGRIAPRPPSRPGDAYKLKENEGGSGSGAGDAIVLASRGPHAEADPAPAPAAANPSVRSAVQGLLRRAASIRVAPLPTANVAGGAGATAAGSQQPTSGPASSAAGPGDGSAAGDREDARGWTNFSAVSRRALAVVRTVRFRVWACLFAISLIAVATFLVCFFLAGQTRGAVDELAAVGRVAHALADLHALSRDLYVGDGALGLGRAALAERLYADIRTVRGLFEQFKFGSDGSTQRAAGFDDLLYGVVGAAAPSGSNLAASRGLSVKTFSYLEAALSVLKANGLLDAAGALVAPGAGAVPGSNQAGGRLEGWEDGASFGDPFLLTVRAELPSLLGAFDRVTDTIIAHVDSSVAWLRSVLAAVLVADALAIALIYALVFGPMLRRLREESSRAAQLLRMIPGGLLASAQLSIRDLLPTSWHTPKK